MPKVAVKAGKSDDAALFEKCGLCSVEGRDKFKADDTGGFSDRRIYPRNKRREARIV